jgi:farnesyl-diphosphate farnesyltransferase
MADLDLLLEKTSRTFALSIPLLPEPTRREVMIAYLLFRIADTFEDSSSWPRESRIEALEQFGLQPIGRRRRRYRTTAIASCWRTRPTYWTNTPG